MAQLRIIFCFNLVFCMGLMAQNPSSSQQHEIIVVEPSSATSPSSIPPAVTGPVLDYEKCIRDDSESFRNHLQDETDKQFQFWDAWGSKITWFVGSFLGLLSLLATVFFTIAGWFVRKSAAEAADDVKVLIRRNIEEVVNADVQEKLGAVNKKVNDACAEIDSQRETVASRMKEQRDELHEEIHRVVDIASALTLAATVLSLPEAERLPRRLNYAIEQLENVFKLISDHRRIGIFLGRLHRTAAEDILHKEGVTDRAVKHFATACEVLERVLKEGENRLSPKDKAALYFNLACYRNLRVVQGLAGGQEEELAKGVLDALHKCLSYRPEEFEEIAKDGDLQQISGNQDAMRALKESADAATARINEENMRINQREATA